MLGRDAHKIGEDYHKYGLKPDTAYIPGRVFMPALPFLPAPKTGQAEGWFQTELEGIEFRGQIDLIWGHLNLLDYKTKGSFDYLPDLLQDPQALLYARHLFQKYQPNQVNLHWLYLKAPKWDRENQRWAGFTPKAKPVLETLSPAECSSRFQEHVLPTAQALTLIRAKNLAPLDLAPNPSQCLKYGHKYPCPYISKCKLTPAQKLDDGGEYPMRDLLAELQAASPKSAVNPPEAQAPVPAPNGWKRSEAEGKLPAGESNFVLPPPPAAPKLELVKPPAPAFDQLTHDAELGKAFRLLVQELVRAVRG